MMHDRTGQGGNGNGSSGSSGAQARAAAGDDSTSTTAPIEMLPPYHPAPLQTGCVMVRREVVWGLGGVAVGVAFGIWLILALKDRR